MDTTGPVVFVAMMLVGPMIAFFVMRAKTAGKMLCKILEKDKSSRSYMQRVQGNWIIIAGDRYIVNPEAVRFTRYPSGWPMWMQQVVPECLYEKGNATPLSWNTVQPIAFNAKDLATVLEPEWLSRLVKGTQEVGKSPGRERTIQMVTLGAVGLVAVLLFYIISKMGALEGIVNPGVAP